MRRVSILTTGVVMTTLLCACGPKAGTLQAAADTLGAATTKSIEYSGTGRWFQFGQAPSPTLPWPQFDVSAFTAAINFDASSARVEMTRKQTIEPGRSRPAPVEQKPVQLVNGAFAWNLAPAAGAAAGAAPVAAAAPTAVEERATEIWSTPQGFVKAALANNATSTPQGSGSEVSFTVGGKYQVHGHHQLAESRGARAHMD